MLTPQQIYTNVDTQNQTCMFRLQSLFSIRFTKNKKRVYTKLLGMSVSSKAQHRTWWLVSQFPRSWPVLECLYTKRIRSNSLRNETIGWRSKYSSQILQFYSSLILYYLTHGMSFYNKFMVIVNIILFYSSSYLCGLVHLSAIYHRNMKPD